MTIQEMGEDEDTWLNEAAEICDDFVYCAASEND